VSDAATPAAPRPAPPKLVRRFDREARLTHAGLATCFLGLSLTGLPLLFSDAPWARVMSQLFGGYGVTGVLHRSFGAALIAIFAFHVASVVRRVYVSRDLGMLWGPDSIVPQPRDVVQMLEHFRFFVGKGPRPRFERFTYWQKFDYWAVFWGMGIIGSSGVLLWFPSFFAQYLPGWVFNVAFLVHGEEALLAMVFIFTVHFFNENLRPERFPMDDVMFTGQLELEELEREHPAEHERLVRSGRLDALCEPPAPRGLLVRGRALGTVGIVLGLTMVALTLYALLVG
jgi:cytochrome b subunit of formate dehydrogenase